MWVLVITWYYGGSWSVPIRSTSVSLRHLFRCLGSFARASFGYGIEPYTSTEDAIRTWPTTATAVGIRVEHGAAVVFAPFGLDDLFALIVRPNRTQITQQIYQRKVARWIRHWPQLTILPWAAGIGTPGSRAASYPHTEPT